MSKHDNSINKKIMTSDLVVITGAAKRMGSLFAHYFASKGYGLILHYFKSEIEVTNLKFQLSKFKIPVFTIQADLRENSGLENFFAFIDGILADGNSYKLKVFVNSAGEMHKTNFSNGSLLDFDETIGLNLRAPFACCKYAAIKMQDGGLIINISDIASQKNWVNYPEYVISKAGIDSMTRVLARLLSPRIRVNGIAPGFVVKSDHLNDQEWEDLIQKTPMKKVVSPDDICSVLDFILKSKSVTGQTIVVDSGYSLV